MDADELKRLRDLELEKIDIVRKAEISKAGLLDKAGKQKGAIEIANAKATLARIRAEEKAEAERIKDQQKKDKEKEQNLKDTLNTITTLQTSGNKTLALAGKAAAIYTATIDGYAAIQKAYALGFPLSLVAVPLVAAATALNIQKIRSSKAPGFQAGGVVPQAGPQLGDQTLARLNPGEVVLNQQQQQRLLELARSEGDNSPGLLREALSQPIIVELDSIEIARALRDQSALGLEA